MKVLRALAGVVLGYFLFAGAVTALFAGFGRDAYQPAPFWFMAVATVYGVLFAVLAGWLSQAVAGRHDMIPSALVSVIVLAGAIASMFGVPEDGSVWAQVSAIVFMGPAVAVGGWLYMLRDDTNAPPP